MMEIGRLCIKTAGRNAGKHCVIVDTLEGNFVMIDGNVPRKRCNIRHLEPLPVVLKVKKGASTDSVHEAMKKENINTMTTKPKTKKPVKPVKQRKIKAKQPAAEKKQKKSK